MATALEPAAVAAAGSPPGAGPTPVPAAVPVLTTVAEYRRAAESAHHAGRTVGVVPTMGALHAGHRSLIERAAAECDVVVVTVFVNPTQFGEAADLDHYPRTLGADLEVAARAGAGVVVAPSDADLYPDGLRAVPLPPGTAPLARRLEGASRPGHFDGVGTVVPRLLAPAGPCRAYFGEKDFQQLAIVRRLVRELGLPVEVVGCDTVRDADGLALSSRNVRLSTAERAAALVLVRALGAGAVAVRSGAPEPAVVVGAMRELVEREPLADLDYAAVVSAESLEPADALTGDDPLRLLVAARVGPVRLIDNLDPAGPLPVGVGATGATGAPGSALR